VQPFNSSILKIVVNVG